MSFRKKDLSMPRRSPHAYIFISKERIDEDSKSKDPDGSLGSLDRFEIEFKAAESSGSLSLRDSAQMLGMLLAEATRDCSKEEESLFMSLVFDQIGRYRASDSPRKPEEDLAWH